VCEDLAAAAAASATTLCACGRAVVLLMASVGATAPAVEAQSLDGSTWATSALGHMAFVAADEQSGVSTLRLVAPTGEVGRPEALGDVGGTPSVAVGARGDVIVAWADRAGRVWARFRPPGGAFGAPEARSRATRRRACGRRSPLRTH